MVGMTSPRRLNTVVIVCAALTGILTWQVVTWGSLSRFDIWAAKQARLLRPDRELWEVTVMVGLRGIILTLTLPFLVWRSWRDRSWTAVGGYAMVLAFETGLVGALKLAVGRSFPYQGPMVIDSGLLAFPSGHGGNVVALWGFLAWYHGRRRPSLRWPLALLTVLFTLTVGVSSWLIRTHWPTDLAAGNLLGLIALVTVIAFLNASGLSPEATPSPVRATRP